MKTSFEFLAVSDILELSPYQHNMYSYSLYFHTLRDMKQIYRANDIPQYHIHDVERMTFTLILEM